MAIRRRIVYGIAGVNACLLLYVVSLTAQSSGPGLPEFTPYDVACGKVRDHAIWHALGERESMGTTATGEDMGWHVAEAQGKRCAFRIRSTDMHGALLPGTFCFKGTAYVNQGVSEMDLTVGIPALSIVKVSAWPDAIGAEGSVAWWGILGPE